MVVMTSQRIGEYEGCVGASYRGREGREGGKGGWKIKMYGRSPIFLKFF